MKASPYSSVAEPSEPMIRYLSPDSSEPSRRSAEPHSTYSGIDSSSNETKNAIRFWAWAIIVIPSTEQISSAWNSACPEAPTGRSTDGSRQESGITNAAAAIAISPPAIARSSSRRAPATRFFSAPHWAISSPAAAARVA